MYTIPVFIYFCSDCWFN